MCSWGFDTAWLLQAIASVHAPEEESKFHGDANGDGDGDDGRDGDGDGDGDGGGDGDRGRLTLGDNLGIP